MKISIFNEHDSVLLVGEGNFSFSVVLCKLNLNITITATCYETEINSEAGKKNIAYLVNNGVRVLIGVDGTKLMEHIILKTERFDKIIFNFPHVGGKMRIEKNRELLKKFFIATENSLKPNGMVLVTLCNGQGGTPKDSPKRRWDDSWKITEMAAHGNFILNAIELFDHECFQNYVVTGYRGLEKGFHNARALTHIFKTAQPPNMYNIRSCNKLCSSTCWSQNVTWRNIIPEREEASSNTVSSICSITYTFDITFTIDIDFNTGMFYETLYNYAGRIIDNVDFLTSYTPPRERERKTFRISYRSTTLPLYRDRVIELHQKIITNVLEDNLNVVVIR